MNHQKANWKRRFFTIWTGQAVSLITSAILQMAMIWYLTEKTGSAMVLSMATLVGFLPQALGGPMIGVLVDRWSRKKVMIVADMIIAAAAAALAVVAFYMELPVWVIMMVLFIRSIGTAFHSTALNATTPLIVPEEQLAKCAGYSQSLQSASYIISPAAAAFLYSMWDLNAVILLDVLGAMIACIAVAMITIPKPEAKESAAQSGFAEELKAGYDALKHHKGLVALLWVGGIYIFAFMPINALFPLMTMDYFGGTIKHASAAEIIFAVGMLVGGLLLGAWGGFKKRVLTIITSIFVMGAALSIAGLLPTSGFIAFMACCAMMGFSGPFYNGVQIALFQEKIKPEYLGRVFGLFGSVMALAMPLGLVISGVFADQIGVNRWFMLTGIMMIGLAVLCLFIPAMKQLDHPQESEQ
ncbi:MFS transporter [Paenibacillus naphthalenovorans]|uniref:MFS transporter n=1 Tax=Paenibacillus naphthalenovorans TaxID=162209 RepID=A0A0U2N0G3_9BACL|nr:MFS transporter [Paenibacillus naphthalenovorans]ALS24351.1 MFS transporter [Paenibacillus naphthalenovorans]GCL73757.1 MFS transporter [Paenibacillus naphthalenovorans]SDI54788.1 MFS transporter, DHA3 family, macrolide efflux protein [Paenibacillus naphthalenovorans]